LAGTVTALKKGSSSFWKKRSKKLLRTGLGVPGKAQPKFAKLFGSFFQKRTASLPSKSRGLI
jgi:hypothetical protein